MVVRIPNPLVNTLPILMDTPSQNLGGIILQANDRLLKTVAGTLIAQVLAALQLDGSPRHLRCFWPSNMISYTMGFPKRYDTADWELRLLSFIESLETRQQLG